MSKTNVVSFVQKGRDLRAKGDFLALIDADINANPNSVQPIPAGIFERAERFRRLAEENRQRELLEG